MLGLNYLWKDELFLLTYLLPIFLSTVGSGLIFGSAQGEIFNGFVSSFTVLFDSAFCVDFGACFQDKRFKPLTVWHVTFENVQSKLC